MKHVYLLLLVLLLCLQSKAQITLRYHFNNGLHELNSKGPQLSAICAGTFNTEALPAGVTQTTYRFDKGCGLIYDDKAKKLLSSNTYTIEMYFKLDDIMGYKKLIDFDSMNADEGLYCQNGDMVLYNKFFSDSLMGANKYFYVVLTRDGVTEDVYLYLNDIVVGYVLDTASDFDIHAQKSLVFFTDDKATGVEHIGGTVAAINISNFVMDSVEVKNNYGNLASRVGVETMPEDMQVNIYPNPATDVLNIEVPRDVSYMVTDITGRVLLKSELKQGINSINTRKLPVGFYTLMLQSDEGEQVFKFVKQ